MCYGTKYTFKVVVAKVEASNNPCTIHWLLNEENARRVYDLISAADVVQTQILPMILHPKTYIGPDEVEVHFVASRGNWWMDNIFKWHAQILRLGRGMPGL
jgi:hypothetical protein